MGSLRSDGLEEDRSAVWVHIGWCYEGIRYEMDWCSILDIYMCTLSVSQLIADVNHSNINGLDC